MPAIVFPLSIPNNMDFEFVRFIQRSVVGRTMSPFTAKSQKQVHPGQWWEASFRLVGMPRSSAADWIGFLASLNGMEGTFLCGDPHGQVPLGGAASNPGNPIVINSVQSGEILTIVGAPASVANYLRRGDYIQVGSGSSTRLHMMKLDTHTISGGISSLAIWPNLRSSPSSGMAISVQSCQGIWSLSENQRSWEETNPLFGIEFSAIEDI